MIDLMLTDYLKSCQFLSETVTDLTRNQLRFLAAQSQFGITLWNAVLGVPPPAGPSNELQGEVGESGSAMTGDSLAGIAANRLKKGLAPPREIYDVRNRGRIDWSAVPEWAKPVDPEQFEGGHEG